MGAAGRKAARVIRARRCHTPTALFFVARRSISCNSSGSSLSPTVCELAPLPGGAEDSLRHRKRKRLEERASSGGRAASEELQGEGAARGHCTGLAAYQLNAAPQTSWWRRDCYYVATEFRRSRSVQLWRHISRSACRRHWTACSKWAPRRPFGIRLRFIVAPKCVDPLCVALHRAHCVAAGGEHDRSRPIERERQSTAAERLSLVGRRGWEKKAPTESAALFAFSSSVFLNGERLE